MELSIFLTQLCIEFSLFALTRYVGNPIQCSITLQLKKFFAHGSITYVFPFNFISLFMFIVSV